MQQANIGVGTFLRVFQKLFLLVTVGSLFVFVPMRLGINNDGDAVNTLVDTEVRLAHAVRVDTLDLWLDRTGLSRGQGDKH